MNINRTIIGMLALLCSGMAQAQQTAVKLVADGHYFGAQQQFERFLSTASEDNKSVAEAEALSLVCDYVLQTPGTEEKMGEWIEENPTSQYNQVMSLLRRNLLVKNYRFEEAIELFFEEEKKGASVTTPLAYPLTKLSEEINAYTPVIYRLAGEKLYDEGHTTQAIPYLERGEETRTSLYKLGMSYYKAGMFSKALSTLTQSAGVDQDEMAQNALLHAGIAALQTSDKKSAEAAFKSASQMSANQSLREQSLYNYALTLHEKSSPAAVNVMEQYLNEYPTSKYATSVSQCLTEVYMKKKDYTKALSAINKAQTKTADTESDKQKVLYNLAFQELSKNAMQNAITYASQSIALGNQDAESYAESYYVRGDCNYRLGNYDQAANDLNTAINLGKQTPNGKLKNNDYAIYSLGYALFKKQQFNSAISQFEKIANTEEADVTMKADVYNRIGDCYLNVRNYDEANAFYQKAKETCHSYGDYAMLQQAYIQGLKGNYEEKIAIIDKMNAEYTSSSLNAKSLFEKGRAYVLSGNNEEATSTFNRIIATYPQSEFAQQASEELQTMANNIAIQDSIRAAEDSIARAKELAEIEIAKAPVIAAIETFNKGQHQQAEQQILDAIDKGISKPYWLARAFILLSDIYKAEGRTVEAKETLQSLKANYKEDDDIQTMIKERL